jgi:carbon-monoxide dehydrogenase medium subunit
VLPETVEQAVDILAREDGDAMVVAGGTAVSLMLHHGLVSPSALIALSHLPGLREITRDDGIVRIGALVTHAELVRS